MAPPIPGLRKPVQVRHRTAGDVLAGIGAIILLTALTIGVPIALVAVVGLPVPPRVAQAERADQPARHHRDPAHPVGDHLAGLDPAGLVRAGGGQGGGRHDRAQPKVPLAGATQSAAHRLVTAALLLFTAAAALTPAVISHGPPRPAHSVSARARP